MRFDLRDLFWVVNFAALTCGALVVLVNAPNLLVGLTAWIAIGATVGGAIGALVQRKLLATFFGACVQAFLLAVFWIL